MVVEKINKVFKNFLSMGFSNLVSQVLLFLMGAYYGRILGVEKFGILNIVQAIMMYFTMITLMGLQTYGMREIAKDKKCTSKIVSNIITLRIITFIICYSIIIVFSFIIRKDVVMSTLILLYGLTLLPLAINVDWVFTALQQMKHNAMYSIIKVGIPFILIFLLLKSKSQINYIPIIMLLGLILGSLYQIYIFFIKYKFNFKMGFDINNAKRYVKVGMPFLISGILAMINCNVDRIILGFVRSTYESGIYSSAYYIVLFLTNIVTVIFTPVFPLLIEYYNSNKIDKLKQLCSNMTKIISILIVPILIGGILLAKDLILLVFGKKYISGYISFSILIVYVFLLFIRETYGYALNSWNKEKKYLKIVTISSITNLILNLIFIPKYGMEAAAITTLISEIINLLLMRKECNTVLRITYKKNILRVLIPSLVMGIVIIILKWLSINIIVILAVSVVLYFVLISMFKIVSLGELKQLIVNKSM